MIKKMPPPTLSVVNSNIFGKHRFACNCITYLLWSSSGVLNLNWIRSFNLRSRTIYVVNTNSRYCLRDIFLLIRKLYPKDFQKERKKRWKIPSIKVNFPNAFEFIRIEISNFLLPFMYRVYIAIAIVMFLHNATYLVPKLNTCMYTITFK